MSTVFLPSAEHDRDPGVSKEGRRERLQDVMPQPHPDKFEGRVMPRVHVEERDVVREAVGVVVLQTKQTLFRAQNRYVFPAQNVLLDC